MIVNVSFSLRTTFGILYFFVNVTMINPYIQLCNCVHNVNNTSKLLSRIHTIACRLYLQYLTSSIAKFYFRIRKCDTNWISNANQCHYKFVNYLAESA